MKLINGLGILMASTLLASCASTSVKDCDSATVYQKGLNDGKNGKSADNLAKIEDSCTKLGVANAGDSYTYGRKVGLTQYCNESRAKDNAKSGKPDAMCVQEQVPPYQQAYNVALAKLQQEQRQKLLSIQKEENKLKQKELKTQGQLNNSATPISNQ